MGTHKFNYSQSVRTVVSVGAYPSGTAGDICGMIEVTHEKQVKKFNTKKGSYIYLIEVPDGKAFEVAEEYIQSILE